jgi:hypothetical protein
MKIPFICEVKNKFGQNVKKWWCERGYYTHCSEKKLILLASHTAANRLIQYRFDSCVLLVPYNSVLYIASYQLTESTTRYINGCNTGLSPFDLILSPTTTPSSLQGLTLKRYNQNCVKVSYYCSYEYLNVEIDFKSYFWGL